MIFVILGICVLVVSFIAALASLVREQGNLSQKPGEEEAENAPKAKGIKTTKVDVTNKLSGQDSNPILPASGKPQINRPLFPWEEEQFSKHKDMLEADRKKVEALRAQLAELKARAQNRDQSAVEPEPAVAREEPVVSGQNKLTGEIPSNYIRGK